MHTTCTQLDYHIYEIHILQPTRQATIEMFQHMADIVTTNEAQGIPNRLLIVAASQPVPIATLTSEMAQWNKHYARHHQRLAFLYEGGLMALVDILLQKTNRRTTAVRMFQKSEREAALEWLRQS